MPVIERREGLEGPVGDGRGRTSLTSKQAMWIGVLVSAAFTALIALAGGRLESVRLLPDQGASWYYWKLAIPTAWSRATA